MKMERASSIAFLGSAALLVISGCPGSNSAVNWPSERLDNSPSTQPAAVQVADMDSDGLPDVVSLWRGSADGSPPGAVAVHYQDSSGQWTTSLIDADTRYANANALNLADVNGDSRIDVVVAAHDRLTYLRAPANPRTTADWVGFDIAASIGSDYKAWFDVAAAQIDGRDGLDLVAALNDDGRLVWFSSPANPDSADGWEKHSIDSTTRLGADSLVVMDMNGDGRLDVVSSATGDTNGEISWYEQPADPTTEPWPKHVMTTFSGATRLALGDLDGDGLVDLAAVSPDSRRVAWFPHPAQTTDVWNGWVLADYTRLTGDEREPFDIALADMDADGQLDVVVADSLPASLFWYSPPEDIRLRWIEHRIAAVANINLALFAVDDANGDGRPDVFAPIDQEGDDTLDRVERFINPLATPE